MCMALAMGLQPWLWGYSPTCPMAACQLPENLPKTPAGAGAAQWWCRGGTPHHPGEVGWGPAHPLPPTRWDEGTDVLGWGGVSTGHCFPMSHHCCYPKTPFLCSYSPFSFGGMRGPGTVPQPGPRHGVRSSSFCLCLLLPGYFYPRQWAGAVPEPQPPAGLGVRAGAVLARRAPLGVWLSAVGKQGDIPVSWGWGQPCQPAVCSINPQLLESWDGGKVKPTPKLWGRGNPL